MPPRARKTCLDVERERPVGMPTAEEKAEVFSALVENGLSFIERSASELEEHLTLSIAHFAAGLELVLKARPSTGR